MQRMLSSGVRTANGDEADYFFIPLIMRARSHAAATNLQSVLYYIAHHWPWWNARGGGHRHLMAVAGASSCVVTTTRGVLLWLVRWVCG